MKLRYILILLLVVIIGFIGVRYGKQFLTTATTNYTGTILPTRPSEAFNIANIKNATLADLLWQQTGAKTDTATGVRIIDGTFSPGSYTTLVKNSTTLKTVTMKSAARFYYPTVCGSGSCSTLPIAVFANHLSALTADNEAVFVQFANQFKVAILVHGEDEQDAVNFGYSAGDDWRNAFVNSGISDIITRNANVLVNLQTSNYGYFLARTNMLALTLAIRGLEAADITWNKKAGLSGSSKEGYASWIVSAVDDRFQLVNIGGFQRLSVDGLSMYEYNSACGPNGASTISENVNIPAQLTFRDWLKNRNTSKASPVIMVADFPFSDLKPLRYILHGDVGFADVTSDYFMHDSVQFTITEDTAFLDSFKAIPIRYERMAQSPSHEYEANRQTVLRGQMVRVLASADLISAFDSWAKVTSANVDDTGTKITITTRVQTSGATPAVNVYWAESPNREFNDADQTPWNKVQLNVDGGVYKGSFTPTAGQEVAWFIEVEEHMQVPSGDSYPRRDATPIHLLRELPKLSCTSYPAL